jgi:hypothetical protein
MNSETYSRAGNAVGCDTSSTRRLLVRCNVSRWGVGCCSRAGPRGGSRLPGIRARHAQRVASCRAQGSSRSLALSGAARTEHERDPTPPAAFALATTPAHAILQMRNAWRFDRSSLLETEIRGTEVVEQPRAAP